MITTGLKFYPTDDSIDLSIAVLKKPKVLSDTVDPELDDYVMYDIIMIALQLGGVSTRDEEIIQDIRSIAVQGKWEQRIFYK